MRRSIFMEWRVRESMKTSSREKVQRTGRPCTARVMAATRGSITTSCLAPKPPPM